MSDSPTPSKSRNPLSFLVALCVLALVGCSDSSTSSESSKNAGGAGNAKLLDKLALADEADGTTDQVIEKCITCGLHMDGDAKFAVETHGYKAHLCSESCQQRFASDPDRAVLALKPEQ